MANGKMRKTCGAVRELRPVAEPVAEGGMHDAYGAIARRLFGDEAADFGNGNEANTGTFILERAADLDALLLGSQSDAVEPIDLHDITGSALWLRRAFAADTVFGRTPLGSALALYFGRLAAALAVVEVQE